jgi:hypothetical protein
MAATTDELRARAEECRLRAADLRERAKSMTTAASRAEIEKFARQWDAMADQLADLAKPQ